jgi:hypothetical protein
MHSPNSNSLFWSHTLWFMTDYAVPTFLKEIPDWLKFPELRFINRYDWIPVVIWAGCFYLLGEWAWFSTLTWYEWNDDLYLGFHCSNHSSISRHICG